MKKGSSMFTMKTLLALVVSAVVLFPGYASEKSDAEMLRNKTDKESRALHIAISNFGGTEEKNKFQQGLKLLKIGKLRYTQSRYKTAIEKYKEYLALQSALYKNLCSQYIDRTQAVLDAISEDLVDHIDTPKVKKYFELAYRNLKDAKTAQTRKYYPQAINTCRKAKNFAIKVYDLVGSPVPVQYQKDLSDSNNKIHK